MATADSALGARNTDHAQALALAGLLAGASLSLARLYVGTRWWLPTWLTMASALGLAALLRRMGAGQLLSLLAMAAGFVVVAGILLFPNTLLVVIPTRATLSAMVQATDIALQGVRDKAAPVEVTREFLLLTCCGAWAVATAADGLAFRARQPLLSLVPALGLFVFPAVVRPTSPAWYTTWFLAGAAGLLLFEGRARLATWGRWVSSARSRPGSGWRLPMTPAATTGRWLALAASLVALGVPWLLPGYGQRPLLDFKSNPGADSGVGLNPFVSLRTRLRSPAEVAVFDVTAKQGSYWRVMVLDRFDGTTFQARDRELLASLAPFTGSTASDQDPELATEQLTQTFRIRQLDSLYLPAATAPTQVNAGRGREVWQSPGYRALSVKQRLKPGFTYTVVSRVATPKAADLAGEVDYDKEVGAHPELRDDLDAGNLSAEVRNLAQRVVKGKDTPFAKALALQDWFTDSTVFHYSLDVPALASGGNQLERFLVQERTGYCEQFAIAMAVLARAEHIPARVALGFTSGKPAGDGYEVTTHDAHAWPELWFPRAGWVRFEPTPRVDGQAPPPPYTTPEGRQTGNAALPALPGGATSPTTPDLASREQLPPEARNGEDQVDLGSQRDRGAELRRRLLLGLGAGLLLLAVVPAVKWTRNLLARRRAASRPRDAVAASYAEVAGWASDAGIGRRGAETPNAYARRLSSSFAEDASPVAELTGLFERAEYARPAPATEEADRARRLARAARSRLARRLGWRRRLLAALSPRSLFAPRPALRR
jgi:transglutaminase-like putative cysteine protease